MQRAAAVVLALTLSLGFVALCYYGVRTTVCSAIVFGLLVYITLLLYFYPISCVQNDPPDFTLWLYGLSLFLSFIILAFYLVVVTLSSRRDKICHT